MGTPPSPLLVAAGEVAVELVVVVPLEEGAGEVALVVWLQEAGVRAGATVSDVDVDVAVDVAEAGDSLLFWCRSSASLPPLNSRAKHSKVSRRLPGFIL